MTDIGIKRKAQELDSFQPYLAGSSILGEAEMSVHDESFRRTQKQSENETFKKSKKKRSSLSSHRRSITGDILPTFHIDTESESQTSTDSGSQGTGQLGSDKSSQDSIKSLQPNPENVQIDLIIAKTKARIAVLDNECKQWNDLLGSYQEEEAAAKELASNLKLSEEDIPADVKQLAVSKYMTCRVVDISAVRDKVKRLLQNCAFDREECLKDLHLIKEIIEEVKISNHNIRKHLTKVIDEETKMVADPELQLADTKEMLLKYSDYS